MPDEQLLAARDRDRAMLVVKEVRRRGPVSQTTLRTELAMPRETMRRPVKALIDGGVLVRSNEGLSLRPDLGLLVGVDVTHSKARIAISDLGYQLKNDPCGEGSECEITIGDPTDAIRKIASTIADALEAVEEDAATKVVGIGLSLPGPILREANRDEPNPDERTKEAAKRWDRRVQAGLILPNWDGVPVAENLATRLKRTHGVRPLRHTQRRIVWMENDASAGALGAHTLAKARLGDKAPDDLVYVRITRGIGGGIINKGHLVNGARGFAGELGHMTVNPTGALCTSCGGRGCLDTLASNRALVHQLAALIGAEPSHAHGYTGAEIDEHLQALLKSGHPAVDRALWDAGWHVGTVLANVACMINPSWIVLDGDIPAHRRAGGTHLGGNHDGSRPFVDAVQHAIERNAMPQVRDAEVKLWRTDLKDPDGSGADLALPGLEQQLSPELLGALALAVDHLGDGYLLRPIEEWLEAAKPGDRFDPAATPEDV